MSAYGFLPVEQREQIAALIGDAKPAADSLLLSFGEAVRDRREHEHPTWEDLFCLNLSSYMGERMAPVLRRLLDAEAEVGRLRAEVAAPRPQLAAEGAEAGGFFQPGHTYTSSVFGGPFTVTYVATHPGNGERYAHGWVHYAHDDSWAPQVITGLFDRFTEVAEAGEPE